ncbi:efflux RND transporter periplasmic adaptor subunit [Psychromonas sp. SP041]|uniref:efflux RND transporter periplasmic adaptor subunit n=1 Tax=Psychromonas sp. SP041 TaxID=1365007 RepID=UPI00040571B7|nr:efflux RND transporter periplasmic adaptor subunit [Psychromonas sp. SP041]
MNKYLIAAIFSVASLTLIGCVEEPSEPASQRPLQAIDVAEVLVTPTQKWHTYTTRLEAPEQVSLMPRVSGVIEQVSFHEGDQVKQGDLLFKLDSRPFTAVVAGLKAQVNSAQAALQQLRSEAQRAVRLVQRKAISTEQAESRASALRQGEAQLASLKADLSAAQLDLEFTAIRSPIDGVISRTNITRGNNILAGQTVLTSIVSNKEMYGYFDIDERTWNSSFDDVTAASHQQVVMQKVGQTDFPYSGYINFIDNRINSSTGTLRVRAVFDEKNKGLRAGSFARVRLAANEVTDQVVIPSRAIGTDLKNSFVLTVGENDVLQYTLVELGERYGSLRAITSGLKAGDVIAVNGPARVGPGMPIKPNSVNIDSAGVAFTLSAVDEPLTASTKE